MGKVTRSDGTTATVVPRTSTNPFTLANDYYTVLATDPASTATPYKFTLDEYADQTTSTILKSSTKTFDVAQATIYLDTNGTLTPQNYLGADTTGAVKVLGLWPGQKDWNTTWYLPDGTTVVGANTGGGDRPDSNSSGVLAAGSFLQYEPRPAPNTGTDVWNWQSNYETKGFRTFSSTDAGTWSLKLQKDGTHFVTLSAFTVDTAVPAAPAVTNPPGPVTINAGTYTIAGTATDDFQLARVQVWVDTNGDGRIDNGEAVAGSQAVTGTSANFSIPVPLAVNAANHFKVIVTDAAGNVSAAATVPAITQDASAPAAPAVAGPAAPAVPAPVAVNAGTDTITGSYTFSAGAGQVLAGEVVHDAAGNASAKTAGNTGINEDPTPPAGPSASVAFGPFGEALVVVTPDGTMMQYSQAGAVNLTQLLGIGPVNSAGVAIGPAGEVVVAVGPDGTITQYSQSGVINLTQLLGIGPVSSAGVAFGPFGEVLVVVTPDGTMTQYSQAGVLNLSQIVGLAQLAGAGGGANAGPALDEAGLREAVAGALGRLSAAGVAPALVARLAAAHYVVGAAPPGWLGETLPAAGVVVLSPDAAGLGWFVDPTPAQDEEFTPPGPGGALAARRGTAAARRADLLTVVLHEMAHLAGRPDQAGPGDGGGLLNDVLDAGVRRTDALDRVFAGLS